jgi:hypothetical protein
MADHTVWRILTRTTFIAVAYALAPISCTDVLEEPVKLATEKQRSTILAGNVQRQSRLYSYGAKTSPKVPMRTEVETYYGSAPYICSPSGFGQKSRCFRRNSL